MPSRARFPRESIPRQYFVIKNWTLVKLHVGALDLGLGPSAKIIFCLLFFNNGQKIIGLFLLGILLSNFVIESKFKRSFFEAARV